MKLNTSMVLALFCGYLLLNSACTFSKGDTGLSASSEEREAVVEIELSSDPEQQKQTLDQVIEKSSRVQKLNDLDFEARFIPAAFHASKEYLIESNNKKNIHEAYSNNSGFLLRISNDKIQSELLRFELGRVEDYYKRIEYYSFKVNQDISLVLDETDTVPCAFHHFERSYGISPDIRLMVNFNVPESRLFQAEKVQCILYDRVFGNGDIKFQFNKEHLAKVNFPKN